ncbi:MAG: thioredoxin-disulfide reductase, partial [Armatimonadetes bacterium CG07_land_8_20_14_0_80_40_9]
MEEKDVIIIGGGPAGLSAGIYSVRNGLKTIIIDK